MRTLLRFATFVGGLVVGFAVLFFIQRILPGIWLPLALGAFLVGLIATEPWVRETRWYFAPASVALAGGIVAGWTQSNDGLRWRTPILIVSTLLALAAAVEAFSVATPPEYPKCRRALFVPIVMAWIVADASSSHAGAGGMIDWVVAHLHLSLDRAHTLVFWIRKSIHFVFYGSLGLSAALASRAGRSLPTSLPLSIRFGFLYALLVATFDETRQSSQPGRTGSVYDVLLDLAGASTFLMALYVIAARRTRRMTL